MFQEAICELPSYNKYIEVFGIENALLFVSATEIYRI